MQDTVLGFQQAGCEVTLLPFQAEHIEEDPVFTQKLFQTLCTNSYDFVFSINYFPVIAQGCYDANTLYVSWTCDNPLLAMYHSTVFYPTNVIFTFDYSNYLEFRQLGVSQIYHLPLGVNPKRLQKQISSHKNSYDISFVGSLYEKNSYDTIVHQLPSYLCGYLEGAMNAQILVSGGNILETLLTDDICLSLEEFVTYRKSADSFATLRTLFSTTVLGFKTANLERVQTLNYLALQGNWQVHLFTDSPTEDVPFLKTHPSVDYFQEMPQVFSDSAINLNMTIPNIKTGIPLRVWDILGCGGFLLSNYQVEFDHYFQGGHHMDVFEEKEELVDKVQFYGTHETLRQKIAKNGYDLVCREHTYALRIEKLLETVKPFLT